LSLASVVKSGGNIKHSREDAASGEIHSVRAHSISAQLRALDPVLWILLTVPTRPHITASLREFI